MEGLANVGRVVVGLIGVLGAGQLASVSCLLIASIAQGGGNSRHLQQLLVDELQRVDALLEFDVLIGELGLVFGLTQLLLDHLLGALRKRREASATRTGDRQDGVSTRSCPGTGGNDSRGG